MNDLQVWRLWPVLKDRLDSATMRAICNVTGTSPSVPCVYVAGIDSVPEQGDGAKDEDWGRVVVVPTDTLWPIDDVEGWTTKLGFLVRIEFNRMAAPGYKPWIGLERAQAEAYHLLQGWVPTGIAELRVAFRFYRKRRPQPIPQNDDDRDLLFTSSEYRTELSGKGA
jgi:hypothetical protein